METAYFAGGCFWGVEAALQQIPGIKETSVGYMGGDFESPTYQDVCTGTTGHAETVGVLYDESVVTYPHLLEIFFTIHDPTQLNRQGVDIGSQYRSVIFYTTPEQNAVAAEMIAKLNASGVYPDPIVTAVLPAQQFWPAEEYHQSYFLKIGRRYGSGNW